MRFLLQHSYPMPFSLSEKNKNGSPDQNQLHNIVDKRLFQLDLTLAMSMNAINDLEDLQSSLSWHLPGDVTSWIDRQVQGNVDLSYASLVRICFTIGKLVSLFEAPKFV